MVSVNFIVQLAPLSVDVNMIPLGGPPGPPAPTATKVLFLKVISNKKVEVPDVIEVHDVPSVEVSTVPDIPTAT